MFMHVCVFSRNGMDIIDQYLSVSKRFCVNTHIFLFALPTLSLSFSQWRMNVTQHSFACFFSFSIFFFICNCFISLSVELSEEDEKRSVHTHTNTVETFTHIVRLVCLSYTSYPHTSSVAYLFALLLILFHFLFGWRNDGNRWPSLFLLRAFSSSTHIFIWVSAAHPGKKKLL